MKGIVFTVFLEMVEEKFSANMVDDIIDDANPSSGGAYTSVGTYPHSEIVALVQALSQRSKLAIADLLPAFGEYLFGKFVIGYPRYFEDVDNAFDFLSSIETVIHTEVKKLYPDAELPRFDTEEYSADKLVLVYHSPRHFEDIAHGLIQGCIKHFAEQINIEREVVGEGDSRSERFILQRRVLV